MSLRDYINTEPSEPLTAEMLDAAFTAAAKRGSEPRALELHMFICSARGGCYCGYVQADKGAGA